MNYMSLPLLDHSFRQYRQEVAAMRTLVGVAPSSDNAAALSERMQAAVKLAADLKQGERQGKGERQKVGG
jgi:hypothetical protein